MLSVGVAFQTMTSLTSLIGGASDGVSAGLPPLAKFGKSVLSACPLCLRDASGLGR